MRCCHDHHIEMTKNMVGLNCGITENVIIVKDHSIGLMTDIKSRNMGVGKKFVGNIHDAVMTMLSRTLLG